MAPRDMRQLGGGEVVEIENIEKEWVEGKAGSSFEDWSVEGDMFQYDRVCSVHPLWPRGSQEGQNIHTWPLPPRCRMPSSWIYNLYEGADEVVAEGLSHPFSLSGEHLWKGVQNR